MFHWYGFILGAAGLAGYLIASKLAARTKLSSAAFDKGMLAVLVGSIIGARLWHVGTDWHLYQDNLLGIFQIWQGGLSIFGAILGGVIGLDLFRRWRLPQIPLTAFLDCLAFGLPVAQAIGRLANFVNQELYGLPTNLPWGIAIDPINRATGFEQFAHFHPLFAYEAILVLLGLGILIKLQQTNRWQLGGGNFFRFYLVYYLVIRFFLDFLRLQRGSLLAGLGINQWLIGVFLIIYLFQLRDRSVLRRSPKDIEGRSSLTSWMWRLTHHPVFIGATMLIIGLVWWAVTRLADPGYNLQQLRALPDHSLTNFEVDGQVLEVEVVNTPDSISKGLGHRESLSADGMLFVFPQAVRPVFWMKDMRFAIDIIWLSNGRVVGLESNVQSPEDNVPDSELSRYPAPRAVDLVLETVPGRIDF